MKEQIKINAEKLPGYSLKLPRLIFLPLIHTCSNVIKLIQFSDDDATLNVSRCEIHM